MKDISKRLEALEAELRRHQHKKLTLVYADGSTRSMGILEAVGEVAEGDVVDVLAQDDTTRSLLLALLEPWDFSDLPELEGDEMS